MQINSEFIKDEISGVIHKVTTLRDNGGEVLNHEVNTLKLNLTTNDVMQILVGASVLAIPSALTQEVWDMGKVIPWLNVMVMLFTEYIIIATFIYYRSYQDHIKFYRKEFIKRVITILLFSGLIVGFFLALVGQLPLFDDTAVAIKRIIIGMLPASMSATVMDSLK